VGWVKQVYADGSALVEQYNMGGDRSYSVMRVKAPRYLLIG
jgi:surface antigen